MGTDPPTPPAPLRLRNLPLPARLVLSVFLISVGCGYFAALVQLHFQHASPGNPLPTRDDVIARFHGPVGEKQKSKIQTLLEADESKPFNGGGSMAKAFTTKSDDWKDALKDKAGLSQRGPRAVPKDILLTQAEEALREERETERLAVLDWIANGHSKAAYQKDAYCLPDGLKDRPITDAFLVKDKDDKVVEPHALKVKTLFEERCVSCHTGGGANGAASIDLSTYDGLEKYLKVNESQAISKEALIQSTHVHLLSFSMLYLLTGVIFAFSSLPAFIRFLIAPLPLVAQMVDISCWWLTRADPRFADGIIIAGGVVAAGLMLHIVLSLFSMYGWLGKVVLLLLLVAAGFGAWQGKPYVESFLAAEKPSAAAPAQNAAPAAPEQN
jgi:hypothetical protein